jgi:hypothetical protein
MVLRSFRIPSSCVAQSCFHVCDSHDSQMTQIHDWPPEDGSIRRPGTYARPIGDRELYVLVFECPGAGLRQPYQCPVCYPDGTLVVLLPLGTSACN